MYFNFIFNYLKFNNQYIYIFNVLIALIMLVCVARLLSCSLCGFLSFGLNPL